MTARPTSDFVTRRPLTQEQVETVLAQVWAQVLGLSSSTPGCEDVVARESNFFSIGGDSSTLVEVAARVNEQLFADDEDAAIPITSYLTHPTIAGLARHIVEARSGSDAARALPLSSTASAGPIAIIGMAGRFPGGADVAHLWQNLRAGVEALQPLDAIELFDAEFFGLTPREATLMAPEQRLLLECAQQVLETAGYGVRKENMRVGVFVAAGQSGYASTVPCADAAKFEASGGFPGIVANTSAATRISYLMDLEGPSFSVDTACSSSLVAVHLACRALRDGECEMAIAGGVSSLLLGRNRSSLAVDGMQSRQGRCRPFDDRADGAVFASGMGLVALKRLEDAERDRDTIVAVIRGSAINNDGNDKLAYTAPSVRGQANVIRQALATAGVSADSIGYVETHGTGTRLGDSIEVTALAEAFGSAGPPRMPCTLGTLKANIGHLEVAAGIAGLIKAALVVQHGEVPPAIHFRVPNAEIPFETTPFRLNTRCERWPGEPGPRRAGVSSFGIGGTNAHVVLEQAPAHPETRAGDGPYLILVSARSAEMLAVASKELARYLRGDAAPHIADVAFTTQVGRFHQSCRRFVVAGSCAEASAKLLAETDEVPEEKGESYESLRSMGRRWLAGEQVDWEAFNAASQARRVPLPTHPFERRRYWLPDAETPASSTDLSVRASVRDWLYLPTWSRIVIPPPTAGVRSPVRRCCVLLDSHDALGDGLGRTLASRFERVVRGGLEQAAGPSAGYAQLFRRLKEEGTPPDEIVHAVASPSIHAVLSLFQAVQSELATKPPSLTFITRNAYDVTGRERVEPMGATLAAMAGVLSRELPEVTCRTVDVEVTDSINVQAVADQISRLIDVVTEEGVAIRGAHAWKRQFEPMPQYPGLDSSLIKENGAYLIAGGTGGVGQALAERLARKWRSRLALMSRTAPESAPHLDMEVAILRADITNAQQVTAAVEACVRRFGRIDGVIHAAGVVRDRSIPLKSFSDLEAVLPSKITGTRILWEAVRELEPDFFLCCSSLSAVVTPAGQLDYAAANAWQDAFCHAWEGKGRTRFISVNWDGWEGTGMAAHRVSALRGMTRPEGQDVFEWILRNPQPQVLVCTQELSARRELLRAPRTHRAARNTVAAEPLTTELERTVAEVWHRLLGRDAIRVHDNFLDLGGDSLLVIEMATQLEARLRRAVAVKDLMMNPTIAGIAGLLSR